MVRDGRTRCIYRRGARECGVRRGRCAPQHGVRRAWRAAGGPARGRRARHYRRAQHRRFGPRAEPSDEPRRSGAPRWVTCRYASSAGSCAPSFTASRPHMRARVWARNPMQHVNHQPVDLRRRGHGCRSAALCALEPSQKGKVDASTCRLRRRWASPWCPFLACMRVTDETDSSGHTLAVWRAARVEEADPSGNGRQRRGEKGGDLTPAQRQGGARLTRRKSSHPLHTAAAARMCRAPQATRLASPSSRAAKRCCQTPPQPAGATSSFLRTSTIRFHAPLTHTSTLSGTHPSESSLCSFTPTPHLGLPAAGRQKGAAPRAPGAVAALAIPAPARSCPLSAPARSTLTPTRVHT
jgi:hypothetical protein